MGIVLRSALFLVLLATLGCAPKEPRPGEPRTRQSAIAQAHESSTARAESEQASRRDMKPSGPSSGRFGTMPLMKHIA